MTAPAGARTHVDGLLALLRTQLGANVGVDWGNRATGRQPPCLVLYPDPGTPEGSLGDRHRDLLLEFQLTAIGTTAEQAAWVGDAARAVLLTMQPTVTGRIVQPLWQVDGQPVQRDNDVTPPLYFQVAVYQMRTEPS